MDETSKLLYHIKRKEPNEKTILELKANLSFFNSKYNLDDILKEGETKFSKESFEKEVLSKSYEGRAGIWGPRVTTTYRYLNVMYPPSFNWAYFLKKRVSLDKAVDFLIEHMEFANSCVSLSNSKNIMLKHDEYSGFLYYLNRLNKAVLETLNSSIEKEEPTRLEIYLLNSFVKEKPKRFPKSKDMGDVIFYEVYETYSDRNNKLIRTFPDVWRIRKYKPEFSKVFKKVVDCMLDSGEFEDEMKDDYFEGMLFSRFPDPVKRRVEEIMYYQGRRLENFDQKTRRLIELDCGIRAAEEKGRLDIIADLKIEKANRELMMEWSDSKETEQLAKEAKEAYFALGNKEGVEKALLLELKAKQRKEINLKNGKELAWYHKY